MFPNWTSPKIYYVLELKTNEVMKLTIVEQVFPAEFGDGLESRVKFYCGNYLGVLSLHTVTICTCCGPYVASCLSVHNFV